MTQREEFEAWASDNGKWPDAVERTRSGPYVLIQIENQWTTWQAAQAEQPARGWKLVPVEPTLEMLAALGWDGDITIMTGHAMAMRETEEQYKAMLAAAPTKEQP